MFIYRGNTKVPVILKDILCFGVVLDRRIDDLEALVCGVFNCNSNDLSVKGIDSNAKLLQCFLMYDLLHYSVYDIGLKYQIDHEFLSLSITTIYKKSNYNKKFFNELNSLRKNYLLLNPTSGNA